MGIDQKSSQYLVWPQFASCSAAHLLHIQLIKLLTVACGMLSQSSAMAVQSCWILAGPGTCCHTRQSRASQTCSMGDTSMSMQAMKELGTFSASRNCVQIPSTWGCALSCWNMRWWHGNGPQDLVTVYLRIQIAIDKMHLCSKSVAYSCPYHNPTGTIGHSVHNVDINKPLANTRHHTHHLRGTVETVINPWRFPFSSMPVAIEGEHLSTEVGYDAELQSGQDPVEDDEHADELPWDSLWQFVQKLFCCPNPQFHQLSRWLVSHDPTGEEAGCGGLGLVWLHMVCCCEVSWTYCQIL
jgi:hypothetical protein